MPPKIAVITGPTATGKTRLGVLLAQRLGGEVVSADSMQLYRGMDIGTAKPTPEEMQGVPHHLIDVAEPWENWSAARYVEAAGAACRDILARGRLPIVVGGTGLYIDSLVRGLGFAAVDETGETARGWNADVVVDAIIAKRNTGTSLTDAPVVIGVGPGFYAGRDCHAVVETMRGHYLGRVILDGEPIPNTNIPGLIGGYAGERVLRAPADGIFRQKLEIGAMVQAGDIAGEVEGVPMRCTIAGVLRGILPDETPVFKGMKSGDVDPRCKPEYCTTISDKALAVGGGVVEAVLYLRAKAQGRR